MCLRCLENFLRTSEVVEFCKKSHFHDPNLPFGGSTRFENFVFADVLCHIEGSMCRMVTPFVSEDTLHLKEVSGNMFGGVPRSRKFFRGPEDEALLLLKRNFL